MTISTKKRIWGWWFFDWASQPVNTLLLTFIFGPYFAEVARGYYLGTGLDKDAADAAAQGTVAPLTPVAPVGDPVATSPDAPVNSGSLPSPVTH